MQKDEDTLFRSSDNRAEAAISLYSKIHNIPENAFKTSPELGNAKTVELVDSLTTLGIRLPMHDAEKSVVRPYTLVDDIKDAIEKIKDIEGVVIAVPRQEGVNVQFIFRAESNLVCGKFDC